MANKYDLKTCIAEVTTAPGEPKDHIGGTVIGAVPQGRTRFITSIKIVNTHTAAVEVRIGEGDATNTLDRIKDQQLIAKSDTIMYPDAPDMLNPIMTIAAEKFLTLETDVGTADVVIGYYDE